MDDNFDIRQEEYSSAEGVKMHSAQLQFADFSGQQKVVENLEVFVEV